MTEVLLYLLNNKKCETQKKSTNAICRNVFTFRRTEGKFMEEKKVSKTGNKYYEVILDWFRQQILSGQMKGGRHDSFRTGAGCSVWCKRVPVREALRFWSILELSATDVGMTFSG